MGNHGGEQDGTEMLAMASRIIKDYRSGAFLYLAMGDKPAENGEFPIFVFNWIRKNSVRIFLFQLDNQISVYP